MKNYIVSLSKRALLLSGALAIFTACDDGDLGDIYKGNSSGEYVSDVNWTDAAECQRTGYLLRKHLLGKTEYTGNWRTGKHGR